MRCGEGDGDDGDDGDERDEHDGSSQGCRAGSMDEQPSRSYGLLCAV